MNFFLKMIQDDAGNTSSMRIIVLVIVLTVLFNWTYYNIANHQFTPLNFGEMAAMIGALMAKAIQKGNEEKVQRSPNP